MAQSKKAERIFKAAIVLRWLAAVVVAKIAIMAYGITAPPLLQSYVNAVYAPDLLRWLAVISFIFSLIVAGGLFLIKRWARALYLPSLLMAGVLSIFMYHDREAYTPYIQRHALVVNTLSSLYIFLDGIILLLAYRSPLRHKFEQSPTTNFATLVITCRKLIFGDE